jgi:hypothetical protein
LDIANTLGDDATRPTGARSFEGIYTPLFIEARD